MSNNYTKVERYYKDNGEYQLLSQWTSADSVELNNGSTVEEKIQQTEETIDFLNSVITNKADKTSVKTLLVATNTIKEGDDLDTYVTPGEYNCVSAAIAKSLLNCPYNNTGFKLTVEHISYNKHIRQTIDGIVGGGKWFRITSTETISWQEWQYDGVVWMNLPSGSDLNSYLYAGKYTLIGTYSYTNLPTEPILDGMTNGFLEVIYSSGTTKQIIRRIGMVGVNDHYVYTRSRNSSGTWSPWVKNITTNEIHYVNFQSLNNL